MSIEAWVETVDAYFAAHLDKDFWAGLAASVRSAAVQMAINDIAAAVGCSVAILDTIIPARSAVAEQAVFLVRNHASLTEGKVVTSEGVDGVSTGYTLIGANAGMSPRAECFILAAKRSIRPLSVRISRG